MLHCFTLRQQLQTARQGMLICNETYSSSCGEETDYSPILVIVNERLFREQQ